MNTFKIFDCPFDASTGGRKTNVFKKLIVSMVFLLMVVITRQSFATCTYSPSTTTYSVSPSTVTISPSLAVGSKLPITLTFGGNGPFSCSGNIPLLPYGLTALTTPLALAPGFSDVWATRYPGIGVRFHLLNGGTLSANTSADVLVGGGNWNGGQRYLLLTALSAPTYSNIDLIKTGPIPAGTVPRVQIASDLGTNIKYSDGSSVVTLVNGTRVAMDSLWLNSFNIVVTAPTCSLSTSSATFNMGTVITTAFTGGAGSHQPWVTDQSLISGGCNATTVSMTFAGTAAAAPYGNAFANAGGAKGVALELWQKSGLQAIPNSTTPINFAPQGSGGKYTFSARYIQTASTVTAGSVSATVTVTVDYK